MKNGTIFKVIVGSDEADAIFAYFMNHLRDTIKTFDWFVNWGKVIRNYNEAEIALNLLNILIGKDDIEAEALKLLQTYPEAMNIVPALLAVREKRLGINIIQDKVAKTKKFDFTKAAPEDGVVFLKETGFLTLVADRKLKSIPDYFIGVEVGLDSNGRKNRTGTAMENLAEHFIQDLCLRNGFEYIAQATAASIKAKWGKFITVNKSSKRIDFAVNTPKKLFLIETNYYEGGGSKLKATAGEYIDAYHQWTKDGHQFIWITDGLGWKTAMRPLWDSFNIIDYILNIDFIQKGILEELLKTGG